MSFTFPRRIFLSSISILNSLSSASWMKTQVLTSNMGVSGSNHFVSNVIGIPSHLWGSNLDNIKTFIEFIILSKPLSYDFDYSFCDEMILGNKNFD